MRQGKRQQLARQQRRGRRDAGRNSGAVFGLAALREHHQDAARGLVAGVRVAGAQDGRVRIDLDFRPRPVSSAELEEWHEYATKNYLKFMIAVLPLIREAGSVWEGFTPASPITTLVTAPFRLESEIGSYLEGRQTLAKTISDVGKTVTSVVPAPASGNLWRIIEYTDSFNQGKEGDIYNPYLAVTEGADKDK